MTSISSTDRPAHCENCAAPLHGHYCHACGQSVINPVRNASHALEEVFESFWHLDGRIFRSLLDLMVPGRVACNYLAGKRVRYVAPLRLFVILSVLTFFVAQFTVDFGNQPLVQMDNDATSFAGARTAADVDRLRDAQVRELQLALANIPVAVPGARAGINAKISQIQAAARKRKAALPVPGPSATTNGASSGATSGTSTPATAVTGAEPAATPPSADQKPEFTLSGEGPWDEKTNPVQLTFLPGFANRWLNRQIGHFQQNVPRVNQDPSLFRHAMLSTVPTVLFLMVPVFALLLKLGYLGSGRLYLEHLVVALYSHAFLLVSLLALFLLIGLAQWLPSARGPVVMLEAVVWLWMPLYVSLMQKRVYGDGWPVTILRYTIIGTMYLMLVGFAGFALVVTSMVRI